MHIVCFDLDDTLYKEVDYLKSAYMEIAAYAVSHCEDSVVSHSLLANGAYNEMYAAYKRGENAFERLNEYLKKDICLGEYLKIYREHRPNIKLSEGVVSTLDVLKDKGDIIGIITDGRSVQQRNKIDALGIYKWIFDENIVISEEFGSEKPNISNYQYFMNKYPKCRDFAYVGDNPIKDFIAPNSLGWATFCLEDDGRNIHSQSMKQLNPSYWPAFKIKSLRDLMRFYR